ncbi:MAG TPA: acetyl-coenzyme A synthetase, partial [Dehalococcoidia bacterium]|nr:acetyl-coenzyme A synthetase [Dehalococcoidia bacterium]
ACARIGAIHSIVFGGFSAEALADRIADATCTVLITCNGTYRGDRPIPMKPVADEAMTNAETQMGVPVDTCIVVERIAGSEGVDCEMQDGRDLWWDDVMADASPNSECEVMEAEDPLFILYTSGSTGKPKGVQHTTGGYMVYASQTHKYIFDYHDGDIYFCTADIGWVT